MKTFVIHLDRASARKPQVAELLAAAPYPAEVLPAVDGAALDNWPLGDWATPRYPFELRAGEVGCFLSHRVAWQRILDEGLDGALVLEDDVELEDGFTQVAELAAANLATLGFIQFQTRPVGASAEVARRGNLTLVRPQVTPLRTSAQMVHRDAAARLLAASEVIDRPVDAFLQMHWETCVRLHAAAPARVRDRTEDIGGSTIQRKRKSLTGEAVRAFKRARYRSAIRRLSQ